MSEKSISMKAADNIRILSAAMVEQADSGHPGGPMGGADFMHVLFSEFLQFDPSDMTWFGRDRFYLDAGHMSAMLYSTMALFGKYSMDDLKDFRQWKSVTPGHPEVDFERGIENTSGPLGLGHAFGIGSAVAERFLAERFGEIVEHKTYIYISDGGVQEEISQGAGRIAGFLGLGNIIMFYDANEIQLSTEVDEVTKEDTAKKYEAWGWHVLTIDGNDHDQIRKALRECNDETGKPSLIIGQTTMGKGVRSEDGELYEGEVELHGKPLGKSKASYQKTIEGLGGDVNDPFTIFEDVANHYDQVSQSLKEKADQKKRANKNWASDNPDLYQKLERFINRSLPDIDWRNIEQKSNIATRNASSAVLSYFADHIENMIVASADLSNSDKTDGFLKKTTAFKKGDFSGAFLQAGVSELSMAALATGMALHGGVIPVCATFFAFSDYMKPAIRVAALMEQPVHFIWTHDAFRVGEDGPTHQPIEQEAQIRLLEKLKNHSGNNAFVALRPADAVETTVCWKIALETTNAPSGLILSRQDIQDLPGENRFDEALGAEKGAYIVEDCEVTPDVILLANGSEVSTLFEGAQLLRDRKELNVKIVSVPSEGIFRNQSKEYREKVLNPGVPKFGMTAGLAVNLEGLVGDSGKVWGLEHFGYSAPYTVLDEKFGYTGENVFKCVTELLDI
ncbi:transketolase family protein [Portibacter marinus]|uniref:transketolase family protein n=1 Tax=Portibacter marinus TaxID=2898660 RepID=UPI001F46FD4E|nr:transketolase [Portibacter marinus]